MSHKHPRFKKGNKHGTEGEGTVDSSHTSGHIYTKGWWADALYKAGIEKSCS